MSRLPDLVRDSKLETRVRGRKFSHRIFESDFAHNERSIIRDEYWKREKCIGGGAYGRVWLEKCVQGEKDHSVRAVKEIQKHTHGHKSIDYNRELEAIAKFSHQRYVRCFVRSFGWYEYDNVLCIAMEYCPLGDLSQFIHSSRSLPEDQARTIIYQLAEGLFFLHDNDFAHRDMKPGNVLIKSKPPNPWWVKIGDFGISKRAEDGIDGSSTLRGTLAYMPPEAHGFVDPSLCLTNDHQAAAKAGDIWALGEMTYQLLTRQSSFRNIAMLLAYVKDSNLFPIDAINNHGVSVDAVQILRDLLDPFPQKRLNIKDTIHHAWLMPCHMPIQRAPSVRSVESSDNSESQGDDNTARSDEPSGVWSTVSGGLPTPLTLTSTRSDTCVTQRGTSVSMTRLDEAEQQIDARQQADTVSLALAISTPADVLALNQRIRPAATDGPPRSVSVPPTTLSHENDYVAFAALSQHPLPFKNKSGPNVLHEVDQKSDVLKAAGSLRDPIPKFIDSSTFAVPSHGVKSVTHPTGPEPSSSAQGSANRIKIQTTFEANRKSQTLPVALIKNDTPPGSGDKSEISLIISSDGTDRACGSSGETVGYAEEADRVHSMNQEFQLETVPSDKERDHLGKFEAGSSSDVSNTKSAAQVIDDWAARRRSLKVAADNQWDKTRLSAQQSASDDGKSPSRLSKITSTPSYIPPEVPEGWFAAWSSQQSDWYYVNMLTQRTTWDKPIYPATQGEVGSSDVTDYFGSQHSAPLTSMHMASSGASRAESETKGTQASHKYSGVGKKNSSFHSQHNHSSAPEALKIDKSSAEFVDLATSDQIGNKQEHLSSEATEPRVKRKQYQQTQGAMSALPQESESSTKAPFVDKKQVYLYKGNMVLDIPQTPGYLLHIPHSSPPGRDEFTHFRYSLITCSPEDYAKPDNNYTMRPHLFAKPRETQLLIALTCRSVPSSDSMAQLLDRVFVSIGRLPEFRSYDSKTPKEVWKSVVVVLEMPIQLLCFEPIQFLSKLKDFRNPMYLERLGVNPHWSEEQDASCPIEILDAQRRPVESFEDSVKPRSCFRGERIRARLYEYSTQRTAQTPSKKIPPEAPLLLSPIQFVLCLTDDDVNSVSMSWPEAISRILCARTCVIVNIEESSNSASVPTTDELVDMYCQKGRYSDREIFIYEPRTASKRFFDKLTLRK